MHVVIMFCSIFIVSCLFWYQVAKPNKLEFMRKGLPRARLPQKKFMAEIIPQKPSMKSNPVFKSAMFTNKKQNLL